MTARPGVWAKGVSLFRLLHCTCFEQRDGAQTLQSKVIGAASPWQFAAAARPLKLMTDDQLSTFCWKIFDIFVPLSWLHKSGKITHVQRKLKSKSKEYFWPKSTLSQHLHLDSRTARFRHAAQDDVNCTEILHSQSIYCETISKILEFKKKNSRCSIKSDCQVVTWCRWSKLGQEAENH